MSLPQQIFFIMYVCSAPVICACAPVWHCNTLQHTAIHCNTQHHAAAHCNALQYTATHCTLCMRTSVFCICSTQSACVHKRKCTVTCVPWSVPWLVYREVYRDLHVRLFCRCTELFYEYLWIYNIEVGGSHNASFFLKKKFWWRLACVEETALSLHTIEIERIQWYTRN